MTEKEPTFEEEMEQLKQIVNGLESGNLPLEEALDKYEQGIKLSKQLNDTLTKAEKKLTKMVNEEGQVTLFEEKDDLNDNADEED
ncbi:MAG: exodeoxyribonuclease VII small subunit [Firmicutes bacterium]|uniref:Exodeoxyribonuclease 7 small subunit n=1 Tax=Candidatus Gallilactobacillus intestinavium TaxID=2840838 RepID=A0A9D9E8J8_9LACO|nr:exodeoxyribonuclease VII small subunit [Candidatus Gallilactobacillus intestinavium]